MGSDPGAGGSGLGQGRRRRQRTEEAAPQQEAPQPQQQVPRQQAPEILDEEMGEQSAAGTQDIIRRYRDRIHLASR